MMTDIRHTQSLEDFLESQAVAASLLRATLEPVEDPSLVLITPVVPDGACGCSASLTLPKQLVAAVFPTGEQKICCGKVLQVGRIEFTPAGAALPSIFAQLVSRAASSRATPRAASDCNCSRIFNLCINSGGSFDQCEELWRRCDQNCGNWPLPKPR